MIVTIDGPAGAGKSTVAQALARRLGYQYLDTGAMYRAVALAALRRGLDFEDPQAIAQLAEQLQIEVSGPQIFLDGEQVTEAVRSSEVTAVTRFAAGNPQVRARLVALQQAIGAERDIVTEGRDQGTVVFPEAQCKIYLTASAGERARRRMEELRQRGEWATLDAVLSAQDRRDRDDSSRAVGPLRPAADAIEVVTDGMSIDAVVNALEALVRGSLESALREQGPAEE
jgi:cytidylate kinase